jgi:uncharacterized protein (TIRG00374 family)
VRSNRLYHPSPPVWNNTQDRIDIRSACCLHGYQLRRARQVRTSSDLVNRRVLITLDDTIDPHPRSQNRRSTLTLVIILILLIASALLLAHFSRGQDWQLVREANKAVLILILVLTLLGTLLYAFLVYWLVQGSGHPANLWMAFLVLTASLSANYMTPVKVGIPLRVYLYRRFMGVPVPIGTALITVEAVVGIVIPALIAAAGIALLFPSLGLVPPAILIAFLLVGLLLVWHGRVGRLEPYMGRLPLARFTTRLIRFLEHVQSGLQSLSRPVIFGAVLLDLLMVGLQVVQLWLVLRIFGLSPSLLAVMAVFTISATAGNLSMIPMGLGVRDASFVLLLMQIGISREIALSAAAIQRLLSPGWPLLLGLISTNILGISELTKPSSVDVPPEENARSD